MKNKSEVVLNSDIKTSEYLRIESELEKNIIDTLDFRNKSINIKSKEIFQSSKDYPTDQISGVYYDGVQYIDFKNVRYINSTVIAKLIYLLKSLLKRGVEIKLVNVSDNIKRKIKLLGLEKIFN